MRSSYKLGVGGVSLVIAMASASDAQAQSSGSATNTANGAAPAAAPANPNEAEIVVTARFRNEGVQDIGGSISALSGDQLLQKGVNSVRDLASLTPSLNIQDRGPGRNEISIRGVGRSVFQQDITISPANIGLYLDDVPINVLQGSQLDVPSFGLDRVEVLRGPQGTLFGEGAEGGALRYFTKDPNLTQIEGSFEGYVTTVSKGATDGGGRGTISAPLIVDKLAVRLTYDRSVAPGYIDNAVDRTKDTNGYTANEYRGVLLAQPTDELRIRILGVYGNSDQEAFASANGNPVDLTLYGTSTKDSYVKDSHYIVSGNVSYDFGPVSVQSISSYFSRIRNRNVVDSFFTNQLLAFQQLFSTFPGLDGLAITGPDVSPAFSVDSSKYQQFSQEARLVSDFDGPFNFVVGAFYRKFDFQIDSQVDSRASVDLLPIYLGNIAGDQANNPDSLYRGYVTTAPANPSTNGGVLGQQLGLNQFFNAPANNIVTNTGQQIAGFFEASFKPTEKLKLIVGLRRHHETIDTRSIASGYALLSGLTGAYSPINFPPPGQSGLARAQVDALLPKGSIEWRPIKNTLIYALYSEGLRNGNLNSGGTNSLIFGLFGADVARQVAVFDSERVRALEGGIKATLLDGRLTFNAAGYYNFFNNVQAFVSFKGPPAVGIIDNVGNGHTTGFDIETNFKLDNHIRVFAGGNYTEAKIDTLFASTLPISSGIMPGQPIPFIPDVTFNLGADLTYPIGSSGYEVFGHGVYSYIGEYTTFVTGMPGTRVNPRLGNYGTLDLSVGVRKSRFSLDLRVNNVLNETQFNQASPTTGVLVEALGGFEFLPPGLPANAFDDFQSVRPRTFTLTARVDF